ncbi:MAG: hypothetical protein ACJ8AG_19415 [Ktedonobacteraceae bacterium]
MRKEASKDDHHLIDNPPGQNHPPALSRRPGQCSRERGTTTGILSHSRRGPSTLPLDCTCYWLGFLHCCHAIVLLETVPPIIVERSVNRHDRRGTDGGSLGGGASADPLPALSLRPSLAQRGRSTTPFPHWQREEVAALRSVAPLMREAMASSRRAQLYLQERGLPPALALASGVGYLSRTTWEQASVSVEQQSLLRRWMGCIVFPLGSPAGRGFIGRTLLRWESGMDENAHKALLDLPGAPRRWSKTNPAGWFGFDQRERLYERFSWLKAVLIAWPCWQRGFRLTW